jgi:tripartite ATP-independent transporter DctP family solute receptor
MKRGHWGVVTFVVLLAGFVSNLTETYGTEFNLKFANPVPKDHSWGRGAEYFAKLVDEATGGRVKVAVHHSGALGKIRETIEMARNGNIDFVLGGTGHYSAYVPEINITVLPYLWRDSFTMFAALDGPFGGELNRELNKQGLEAVGWWDNGFRHVSNNKGPVVKPDDLKGLKIRTLPTKVHVEFFKRLGAVPTPIDWTELYQALQQGVVDAQENPPAMVYMGKLHEVQKYYSLTAHVNEPGLVVMSVATLKKLPPELQLAVRIASQKASLWQRQENEKDNETYLKKLQEEGIKINTVPPETIEALRQIAFGVYPDVVKTFGARGQELVDLMMFFNR